MASTAVLSEQASIPSIGVRRALDLVSLGLLALGIIGVAVHNLANHYFWTDESSTFFNAIGSPAPGEPPGDVATAWQGTMAGFLDPGLFHMLVRVWALTMGTDIVTLRFLPFLFFLLYVLAVLAIFRLVGAPWFVAAGGAGVMMLENITPYYAVELRPYSAGLAASVLLPVTALLLIKSPTVPRFILLLLCVGVVGGMQYNTMPISWAAALMLGLSWWRAKGIPRRSLLAVGAAFAVLWLPVFYVVSRGNPQRTGGGDALGYISEMVLTQMPADRLVHVVFTNLLSPTGLPRTIFLILVPLLWWRHVLPRPSSENEWRERAIALLWAFVLAATVATVSLAILGFIPWILGTRWSIAEVGLIAVSLAGLAGIVIRSSLWRRRGIVIVVAAGCLAASAMGAIRLWNYERPNDVDFMAALGPVILSGRPGGTVIDGWSYPDARYWVEYSGEHDDLRDAWIEHGIRANEGGGTANAADIRAFLQSEDDRMLLRSARALEDYAIELPPNVEVVAVPSSLIHGPVTSATPVVLVKR